MTDERIEHEDEVILRALHALDEAEIGVSDDPEVLEYYDVLAYMPVEEIAPPLSLEARVLDAARAARTPASQSLAARRRKTRRVVAVSAAAAIAAVVGLAVVAGNDANSPGSELHGDFVRAVDPTEVRSLLNEPDAKTFGINGDAGQVGRVVLSDGNGALYDTALPARDGVTYWFWVTGPTGDVPVAPIDTGTGRGLLFAVEGDMTGALISAETVQGLPAAPARVVGEGALG